MQKDAFHVLALPQQVSSCCKKVVFDVLALYLSKLALVTKRFSLMSGTLPQRVSFCCKKAAFDVLTLNLRILAIVLRRLLYEC
jgi:hypothetical protein